MRTDAAFWESGSVKVVDTLFSFAVFGAGLSSVNCCTAQTRDLTHQAHSIIEQIENTRHIAARTRNQLSQGMSARCERLRVPIVLFSEKERDHTEWTLNGALWPALENPL